MPFDWNSGKPKSGFDWDSGQSVDVILPSLPKPKVEMKEEPSSYLMRGAANVSSMVRGNPDAPIVSLPEPERAGADASTAEKIGRGAARSGARNISALTSPKNLAIMGGLGVLNAAQLVPGSQPVTVPLAQAANATAATYFAAEMAKGLPEQYGRYRESLKQGDTEGAAEAFTDIGATAVMAAGGAHGAMKLSRPALEAKMGVAKQVAPVSAKAVENHINARQIEKRDEAAMGVRPSPAPVPMPGASPKMVAGRTLDIAAQDIAGKKFSDLSPEESARVKAALQDKAVAKQYKEAAEAQLSEEIPATVPKDRTVPLGPPERTQAQRKAELKARFKPEPPPEPTGVTPGKPAPLQPLGEPVFKPAAESARVFESEPPKSAEASAEVFRRDLKRKPEVPETGDPMEAAKDAKNRIAQEMTGKPYDQLTPDEQVAVDGLQREGNIGNPPAAAPQPYRATRSRRRMSSQGGVLSIPNPFKPKQQAAPIAQDVLQYIDAQNAAREAAKRGPDAGLMDTLSRWRKEYVKAVNDTTAPLTDALKPLDKQAGATEVPASIRMNDLIDRKLGSSKAATSWLKEEGWLDILRDAESLKALDQYMLAKRSLEIEGEGFKSGRDIPSDQRVIQELENRVAIPAANGRAAMTYGDIGKKATDVNNKLLRMAADSGVVNAETAEWLINKYGSYVPIERIQEAVEGAHAKGRGASQVASLARQTIVQKLTGSERLMDDSIVATIHKADKVFSQVARNDAAKFLKNGLEQLDGGKGDLVRPKGKNENVPSERTISLYENGVKQDYVVPPDIAAAAKSLDVKQLGWVVQNLVQPSTRLMKLTTTGLSVPFTAFNILRDIGMTAVNQKGWTGVGGALDPRIYGKAAKAVFDPNSPTMAALSRHGGGFTSFDMSRGQVTPEVELMRAKRGSREALQYATAHPVRTIGALVRASENFLGKSEQFGRARIFESEYRAFRKRGFSHQDAELMAAHEANNALPNYARAGSIGRVLNSAVPYLNARIQGVRSLTRAIERDPVGTAGKITALYTAVAAVTAYNLMDPERRKLYMDTEEYEKRSALIIPLPGAKKNAKGRWEGIIKIPLPQGIDSLTDIVRKGVEALHGEDPVKFNDLANALVGAFTPIEPSRISDNPAINVGVGAISSALPQAAKPTVEGLANFNFFRGQPIEPVHMTELPTEERAYPYTSSTAKALARDVLPKVGLNTSPIKTEAFINSTLGGGGPTMLRGIDAAAEATGLVPKQATHGGADPVSATAERFTTVRGGAFDRKYYDLRKQLQDAIARRELNAIKPSVNFDSLDRQAQRDILNKALGRAKAQVQKIIQRSRIDKVQGPERVKFMRQMLDQYK